jgi:hypothetical protein
MEQQSQKNSTSRHSGFMEAITQRMAPHIGMKSPHTAALSFYAMVQGYAQPHYHRF